jgi:murein DD-endopeptidase MepM/ murein hydrolase activator NlpD
MSNKKFTNGKGYYIALALCAVAIGVSGYLYYSHANKEDVQLNNPDMTVDQTVLGDESDLPVVATQPQQSGTQPTETTVPPSTVTRKPLQTAAPVEGEIVMVYAMDSLGYNPTTRDWRTHNGVDIAAEEGSKVFAAADGTVYTVYEDDTMGMTVVIRHRDGYITKYASLASEVTVKAGDTVTLGQQIGYVGNTALLESAIGDHLHFSVTCNGAVINPNDFLEQE